MSDYANTPHELEWDDEISTASDGYVVLEEGDYNFTVTAIERGRYPGSAKIDPCKMLTATLTVETAAGTANIKYDMPWFSTMMWKAANLFCSVGLATRSEESFRPRINELVGSQGRAHFKPRTYTKKDGGEGKSNNVEKFYDYDPAQRQPSGQQQTMWTPDNAPSRTPWDTGKF